MKKLIDITDSLVNGTLYEVQPRVYAVEVEDDYSRGMLFMRAQEYYESPFPEFQGRDFNIFEYMDHYRKNRKRAVFTYADDWAGYNVPSESLEQCINGIEEESHTPYDHHMGNIVWWIRQHQKRGVFYLIGVDKADSWIMDHEMAHALFYTNPEYRKEMMDLVLSVKRDTFDQLESFLVQSGYPKKVIVDEIQAYLSTGLDDGMDKIRGVKTLAKKFSKIFKKYYGKRKDNGRAKRQATEKI